MNSTTAIQGKGQLSHKYRIILIGCILLAALTNSASAQSAEGGGAFYKIGIRTIDKLDILSSAWKGKKVVVMIVDAASPDLGKLMALDTLYQKNKDKLVAVIVPVMDFNASYKEAKLKKLLLDTMGLHCVVSEVVKGKKSNGAQQDALLKWLTDKNSNSHFDTDIDKGGELFIIDGNGKLFVRFKEPIPLNGKMMGRILGQ